MTTLLATEKVRKALGAVSDCAQTCEACAQRCLSDPSMTHCTRVCLDCATVCATMIILLARELGNPKGFRWKLLGRPSRPTGLREHGARLAGPESRRRRGKRRPGGILKSEDCGRTWQCATTPPNTGLASAADSLHVWAASDDRIGQATVLYTTEDDGATWHPLRLGSLGSP